MPAKNRTRFSELVQRFRVNKRLTTGGNLHKAVRFFAFPLRELATNARLPDPGMFSCESYKSEQCSSK
ncbi:hypothetical protein CUJ84_pRLN3000606 (plasmid) [Rhizobium leguminosarum]|uniref:Uncharacterized protein n=1 Tax=Rhizobium leguminosarum TaxID=384 RepID=A0A2K9ZHH5_RHILE|nr:hypothetical protein CUJ84_pRLN3000606 [Rhizobium leguminosarum]